jgi:hypothetical protein
VRCRFLRLAERFSIATGARYTRRRSRSNLERLRNQSIYPCTLLTNVGVSRRAELKANASNFRIADEPPRGLERANAFCELFWANLQFGELGSAAFPGCHHPHTIHPWLLRHSCMTFSQLARLSCCAPTGCVSLFCGGTTRIIHVKIQA